MSGSKKDNYVYGERSDLGTTGIDEAGLRITGGHSLEDTHRPVGDPSRGKRKRCRDDERELLKNRFDVEGGCNDEAEEPAAPK